MKIPYAIVLSIFAMTIDGLAVGNLHAQSVVQIIANPGMKPVFEELTPQFEGQAVTKSLFNMDCLIN